MASDREVLFRLKAVVDQGSKAQFDAMAREAAASYDAVVKAYERARQALGRGLPTGGGDGGATSTATAPRGGDVADRLRRQADAIRGSQQAAIIGYRDLNSEIGRVYRGIELLSRSMVLFGVASESSIERAVKKLAAFEGVASAVRGGLALSSGIGSGARAATGAAAAVGVSGSGLAAGAAALAGVTAAAVLLSEQLRGTAQDANSWTTWLGNIFEKIGTWADSLVNGTPDTGAELDTKLAAVRAQQNQRHKERDLAAPLAGQLEGNRARFLGEQGNIFALSRARQSAESRLGDTSLSPVQRQAAEKTLLQIMEAQRDALQKTGDMARQQAQERTAEARSRLDALRQEQSIQQKIAEDARSAYTGAKERFGQLSAEEQAATVQAVQRSRQGLSLGAEDARRLRGLGTAEGVEAASRRDIAAAERAGFDRLGLGARELAQEQAARQQVQQLTLNIQSQNQLIVKLETDAANFSHSVANEVEKVVRDIYEQTRQDILQQIQNVPKAAREALAAPGNRAA